MNRLTYLLLSILTACLTYGQQARQITVDINEDDFQFIKTEDGSYAIVSDRRDVVYMNNTEEPGLPIISLSVLIGPDESYSSHTLQATDSLIAESIDLAPNPKVLPLSSSVYERSEESRVSYDAVSYPSECVRYGGACMTDGYKTLSFAVCPFRYDASSKKLFLKRQLTLCVNTFSVSSARQYSHRIGRNMRSIVMRTVVNGGEIDELYGSRDDAQLRESGSDDDYKYVIVTNSVMKPAFDKLSEWKTMKGVRTKVLLVDTIYSKYSGSTNQEKIKRALYDYYEGTYSGLKYVLLGGDVDVVPARMCYAECGGLTSSIPTDHYYACMEDITWDADGDQRYGEVEDSIDFGPDIFVTRVPFNSLNDANAFVDRVIEYERNPKEGFWHNNILMGGCQIDSSAVVDGVYQSDAQYCSEKMYRQYIMNDWGGTRVRFYDTATDFPGGADYDFNAANLQEQLSKGYNFVNIHTHGNDNKWVMEGANYFTSHAAALNNEGYSIILTIACNTNAFDEYGTCLSEAFMRNHNGGILAYMGCSREGWYWKGLSSLVFSNVLNENFYEALFSPLNPISVFGEASICAKSTYIDMYYYFDAYRWLLYGINPLGDPEMPIYTTAPSLFNNVQVSFANGELRVNSNVSGCRICIIDKYDDDFYFVENNANNTSVRNQDGLYQICITKPGYIPYIALAGSNAHLYVQNEDVDYVVHVFTNKTSMGSHVTSEQTPGSVTIVKGGGLIIKSNEVTIEDEFEVELGGVLEIK